MGADAHVYKWDKDHRAHPACDLTGQGVSCATGASQSSVDQVWCEVELSREMSWHRDPSSTSASLHRRAFLAARSLSILPGRTVLEIGAGSGVWTAHLAAALAGSNLITAVVFNQDLAAEAKLRDLPATRFIHVKDFQREFPPEGFDYVVGTDILANSLRTEVLDLAYRSLKPGGQILFFTQNASHPLALCRKARGRLVRRNRTRDVRPGPNLKMLSDAAVRLGFTEVGLTCFEVTRSAKSLAGQAVGLILERAPVARRFSRVVSFYAAKPGTASRGDAVATSLATHRELFSSVSVVVPCHNEEANIKPLVGTLLGMYGDYIREIVIVDDSSTDRTSQVTAAMANTEPRIKLVRRNPPGGVGCALRDGYAAARGKYILSTDCDFVTIAPEFKGLFNAISEGYDGAIGSRFSDESALVRYPLLKILCNRVYHLLLNVLLGKRVRDISNNLKLYRAEILKNLSIEANGFAANAETGLKPILMNYRIREVPTSWIDRTPDMGKSSFSLLRTGPEYAVVLFRTVWRYWRGQYQASK